MAYGDTIANSNQAEVTILRNEIKKDALLNGLRHDISAILWGRLPANSTYEQTIETAEECETLIEIRRVTESRNPANTLLLQQEKKTQCEVDELRKIVEGVAKLQLSNNTQTVAYVAQDNDNNRGGNNQNYNQGGRHRNNKNGNKGGKNWSKGNQNRPPRKCYFCGEEGHIKRSCKELKQWQEFKKKDSSQGNRN